MPPFQPGWALNRARYLREILSAGKIPIRNTCLKLKFTL
jgi:hypothetical protein